MGQAKRNKANNDEREKKRERFYHLCKRLTRYPEWMILRFIQIRKI